MTHRLQPPPGVDTLVRGPTGVAVPTLAADAVAAWLSLPGAGRSPDTVTQLQIRAETAVYRLCRAHSESHVIAKLTPQESVEQRVYEEVLPRLSILSAPYLGAARGVCGNWIFIEDVRGEPYNWAVASHREAAARWLAALHAAATDPEITGGLPAHGVAHWRSVLARVVECVLPYAEADGARSVIEMCDEIRDRWDVVEQLARVLPETLVHGDLVPKNMRVLDGGARVCPIDWGSASVGFAAIDFAYLDPQAYWSAERSFAQDLSARDVRRLSSLGRLFRNLLLVMWLCEEAVSPGDAVLKLVPYARWIGAELRVLRTAAP